MATPRPTPGDSASVLASMLALCDEVDALLPRVTTAEQELTSAQQAIGAEVTARTKAVTDEANASQAGIAAEGQARAQGLSAEATARDQEIAQEREDRDAAIAAFARALSTQLAALRDSLRQALDAETTARTTADAGERQARIDAINVQAKALDDAVKDLRAAMAQSGAEQVERAAAVEAGSTAKLLAALVAVLTEAQLPAACPVAFGAVAVGGIADIGPLDPAGIVAGPFGQAYRITGAGLICPRASVLYDPDAIQVVQARFWRFVDPADPNNDAIDIGIQWLDADDGDAGRVLIRRLRNLTTTSGPYTVTARVPSVVGDLPVIAAPRAAVSWRPYLRTYGADGATAVQRLGTTDATFTGAFAPDVLAITARMGAIEGQVKLGFADKLDGRFLTLPGDPTPRDIPVGTVRMVKNAAMGRISTWANDGGVMVDLGSLTTA